jgi:3-methyl-2-oxobutanoate hydroxymethyltransferase
VLVWTDMAGLNRGRTPRFVKRYADLGGTLLTAAEAFAEDVRGGTYPDTEHSFS